MRKSNRKIIKGDESSVRPLPLWFHHSYIPKSDGGTSVPDGEGFFSQRQTCTGAFDTYRTCNSSGLLRRGPFNAERGWLMKSFIYCAICFSMIIPLAAFAQESSPLEEVQHGQYVALQNQMNYEQQRFNELQAIKTQVDSIISQVRDRPVSSYGQDAERYRELELLVPAAMAYSQELARRQRQLDELQRQKVALRSQVIDRRGGSLPTWWVE